MESAMGLDHSCSSSRHVMPRWRRRGLLVLPALLSLAGLFAGCVAPAPAEASPRLLRVEVVDRETGWVLHEWHDHGVPVVAGRPGARYAVRLTNVSGQRLLAVVAIDGVNVLSGETASPSQRGYVFDAGESYEVSGWRKSDDEVAAFEFTSLSDSYAARTGRPLDVGVIGVAVFREWMAPAWVGQAGPDEEADRRREAERLALAERTASPATVVPAPQPAPVPPAADKAAPAPVLAKPAPLDVPPAAGVVAAPPVTSGRAGPLGTGHGAREYSHVTRVDFRRATTSPEEVVRIRYDSLERLVAAGVIPRRGPFPPESGPRAFPADPGAGYVPDPPAW
jgi:hypothetical protein